MACVVGIDVVDVGDFEHYVSSAVVPPGRDANVLHAIPYEEEFSVLDPIVKLLVELTAKICIFEKVRMNSNFAHEKCIAWYTTGTLVCKVVFARPILIQNAV